MLTAPVQLTAGPITTQTSALTQLQATDALFQQQLTRLLASPSPVRVPVPQMGQGHGMTVQTPVFLPACMPPLTLGAGGNTQKRDGKRKKKRSSSGDTPPPPKRH